MKTTLIVISILGFLVSCSSGPVHVAKTEQEGLKSSSLDPKLAELTRQHLPTLKDIFRRYQRANIDIYPGGIGFTTLSGENIGKHYYLLVQVRPRDISFDETKSTPQERFSEVFERQLEKNLKYITKRDVQPDNIDGLAFGVYWPVRDLSQCDKYGGFIEYMLVYLKKADFIDYLNGEMTLSEVAQEGQVFTSLGLQKAESVKVIEKD